MDRLYTDVAAHTAEEARRFGLVEEHWDVVVVGVEYMNRVREARVLARPDLS